MNDISRRRFLEDSMLAITAAGAASAADDRVVPPLPDRDERHELLIGSKTEPEEPAP